MTGRVDANAEEGGFWGDVGADTAIRRYETLLETIGDGVCQLDAEGRVVAVNDVVVEQTGYDREALLGRHVATLYREAARAADVPRRHLEDALADGPVETEGWRVRRDGSEFRASETLRALREDGTHRGYLLVVRDVTARHEHEEGLSSELERVLGRISDAFYAVDEEFRFTHVNERAAELLEYDEDELLGQRLWDVFPSAAEIGEVWEAFHTARDTQEATSYELYYDTLDFWVEANLYPSETGISVYFRDITERKEREARRTEMMRELQKSEERLRLALEAGEMGTWELDVRTGESPNHSLQHDRIFGYEEPVEEWGLERFLEHVHPTDRDRVERTFEEAFESGRLDFECRIVRADDERLAISVQGEVDFDDEGSAVRAIGVVQDVTERRERERQLEEYRRWNRTLMEHFPNGAVALVDRDRRYVTFGGTPEGDTPVTREDLEGEPIREALPEQIAEVVVPRYEDALAGEPSEFEATIDGRAYQFHFVPVRDDDGEVFAAAAISQEITEQKEREEQLRDAKLQLEAATEAGAVGTWEWHVPADEFVTGASFAKTFGVDPEDAREGVPIERLLSSIHEDDRDRVAEEIDAVVENCAEYEAEYRVRNADDELRWVVARGHVECDDEGEAVTFPGALTDITERRKSKRKLEDTVEKLEESNERLEQFAYAASHDLQEPLRMVTSYLRLLERRYTDELDEEAEEFIEFAVDGADRMREMIDGLLEYSRVETRGDPFAPVDLDAVLEDVLADLQLQIQETDAEITVESLPTVQGDPSQLRQVFQNLLDNALTYHGDDPPSIRVDVERRGGEWVVSIADEGIGIDPGDQDRVFTVFDRLHSHEEYEGTGIGLALCERIVERHGGDIWVESTPGEGATFYFSLLIADA